MKNMKKYDLIIVGAGPAGLSLARELAQTNYHILILDEKKNAGDVRYDTAGSFIDIKNWGLPKDVVHPIRSGYFFSKNTCVYQKGEAKIIRRTKLLRFLEQEALVNQNLEIKYHSLIGKISSGERVITSVVYVHEGKEQEVIARLFVDCSGVSAILGKEIGLVSHRFPEALGFEYVVPLKCEGETIDLFVGRDLPGGYGWIFPISEKEAIIGYGTLDKKYFPQAEKILDSMWQLPRVQKRCVFKDQKKNTGILRTSNPLKRFTLKNVMLIGDTAYQANPLVGEGIRFVMDASRMAAKAISQSLEQNDLALLRLYDEEWVQKYYKQYKIAYLIQRLLVFATKYDWLLDLGTSCLQKLSSAECMRLMKADLDYPFLFKILWKGIFARRSSSVN